MPDARRTPAAFEPNQLDKRTAFYTARRNGVSITQASKMVGIHRDTGTRWEAEAKVREAQLTARGVVIATKQDIAAELTRIGLHDDQVAPRDKVNALATASKVLGYDAPTVTRHEVIIGTYDQYLALIEERERAAAALPAHGAAGAAKAIEAPGGSPIEAKAEAVSPSPNISNSEKK